MKRVLILAVLAALAASAVNANDAGELVVIVNPASGVDRLSREEVVDIFLGRYRKLPSGRAALPIDLEPGNERTKFYELLVKKSPAEISSYWARLVFSGQKSPPFQVADAKTAIELVQSNPNAIAYVDRGSLNSRVKVVLEIKP
jgi:ABC-type phosphate transport system substrate-binding protein